MSDYFVPPVDIGTRPGGVYIPPYVPRRISVEYTFGQVVRYGTKFYRCIVDSVRSATAPATDTTSWVEIEIDQENPFEGAGNYPRAVGYFQDRVFLAGTKDNGSRLHGSYVARYSEFFPGSRDASAVQFDLLSEGTDAILWIAAREALVIGTFGSEWVVQGGPGGLTPSNVLAKRQTTFGSSDIQGRLINENVVFVQKGGRKFLEYFYQNELQAYRADDLTFYSEQVTESGVKHFTFQSDPDPIIWVVLNNGTIAGLTYDKARNVNAWHRHITEGEVESMTVTPGGETDEVWMIVKRTINGVEKRYIEKMHNRRVTEQRDRVYCDASLTLDGGDPFAITAATAANPVAVTAAAHGLTTGNRVRLTDVVGMTELEGRTFLVTVTGTDTFTLDNEDGTGRTAATAGSAEPVFNEVTGLSHLEGEEVAVTVDGGPHARRTVSSGSITLDAGAFGNVIHVGLPYTARVKTMNIMAGVSEALKGRIHAARIRFISTTQARVGRSDDSLSELIFRDSSALYGQPAQLFTGEKKIEIANTYGSDQRVVIESDQPTPLTVAVILPETGVYAGGR